MQVAVSLGRRVCPRGHPLECRDHAHVPRSVAAASKTSSAWPLTFTLRHSRRRVPLASNRKVLRSIPRTFFPYMFLSRMTSKSPQSFSPTSETSSNGNPNFALNFSCAAKLSRDGVEDLRTEPLSRLVARAQNDEDDDLLPLDLVRHTDRRRFLDRRVSDGIPVPVSPGAPLLRPPEQRNEVAAIFDPRLRTGYVQQYSVSLQREIGRGVVIEAAWVGNRGIKLLHRATFLELPRFDHMHRFLPALFLNAGAQVVSVPVRHRPRTRGVSKYGVMNRLWVGIVDLFRVRWIMRRNPPRPDVSEQ